MIVIGGSGDLGVDLVAKKNGNTCIFQCKRWNANVGSTPIQRLYTERSIHHYDKAYYNVHFAKYKRQVFAAHILFLEFYNLLNLPDGLANPICVFESNHK